MNAVTSQVRRLVFTLVLIASLLPQVALSDSHAATYRVTFSPTWSNRTHPHAGFPAHPFFSPLIGGVHSDRVIYWTVGEPASAAIKLLAEEGFPDALASEVRADIERGRALAVLSTRTTTDSPGSNVITAFQMTREFPLVTLVTMFAPTPDWFTGVAGLSLLDEQGHWIKDKAVALYPYDAGTQQNLAYALHQPAEAQRRPVYSLRGSEWFTNEPVGSFRFTRTK